MTLDRKTQRLIREQLAKAIEDRAEELLAMTPAERAERLRLEAEERENIETAAMLVDKTKLAEVIDALESFGARSKPVSAEVLRQHRWETRGVRDMAAAGVPERHRLRLLKFDHPEKERKFARIRELCHGTGAVIALCGMRGSGKTTMGCQLMRERVEANIEYDYADPRPKDVPLLPGRYRKLTSMGSHFKLMFAGHGGVNQEVLAEQYRALCEHSLLVIDELHDAETIAPAMALLVDLVDRRYSENRDTILITNREAADFEKNFNQSIVSRAHEAGAIMRCDWGSSRARKP